MITDPEAGRMRRNRTLPGCLREEDEGFLFTDQVLEFDPVPANRFVAAGGLDLVFKNPAILENDPDRGEVLRVAGQQDTLQAHLARTFEPKTEHERCVPFPALRWPNFKTNVTTYALETRRQPVPQAQYAQNAPVVVNEPVGGLWNITRLQANAILMLAQPVQVGIKIGIDQLGGVFKVRFTSSLKVGDQFEEFRFQVRGG
jgi:hypothetical protein